MKRLISYFLFTGFQIVVVLGQPKLKNDIIQTRPYQPTIISDTTVIIGEVSSKTYIGKKSTGCSATNEKTVKAGTRVFVVGFKECNKNNPIFGFLYEIVFDTTLYYINSTDLKLKGITVNQFKSINTNQFFKIYDHAITLQEKGINPIDFDKEGLLAEKKATQDSIEATNFLKSCKTAGVVLCDFMHFDESEHTKGTGIKFKYYNPTEKVIKYIWTTFAGINPVGDKVCEKTKTNCDITVESIGPLKAKEIGTFEYSYVWHNDLVKSVKIVSVEVQYMDGTKKKILNPKTIMLSPSHADVLGFTFLADLLKEIDIEYEDLR